VISSTGAVASIHLWWPSRDRKRPNPGGHQCCIENAACWRKPRPQVPSAIIVEESHTAASDGPDICDWTNSSASMSRGPVCEAKLLPLMIKAWCLRPVARDLGHLTIGAVISLSGGYPQAVLRSVVVPSEIGWKGQTGTSILALRSAGGVQRSRVPASSHYQ